jgi:hypothetical protein
MNLKQTYEACKFVMRALNPQHYIQNKIFTSTLQDQTPYETRHGIKLDVNNLNVFGRPNICPYS